jgi:hypothetical protein
VFHDAKPQHFSASSTRPCSTPFLACVRGELGLNRPRRSPLPRACTPLPCKLLNRRKSPRSRSRMPSDDHAQAPRRPAATLGLCFLSVSVCLACSLVIPQ